ncbi:SDR family NAD(P)-dependent oxidoreductase [Dermatophilus congolensis]|uniref:SDR family NAD(P)-dependent oxidoreductase n=1 Tax=Dermatophilus congolensis TaxID=1863 RepID=UPI001AAECB26|nr:SDR family NAD(P)-dependent oxidoreductase [Dermatophilus congolensis]MBO3142033.1 SDR family NAD(P)-dependent oxidoreductase [Dermatophilus congolensis]MBO3151025.1 SDR family NAD(P)-dependent oxidoreductase [Dermatophilus congolensis]MBO3161971.1 SDR family NAD(P)-dependent oxidoreductase [Dermatophilus congolensis]MBO3162310.1 SDR family NAD(P)-dependent oxidoreductase [Dermatophilus congolensis]MBO3175864.1 SDR family NAD(P)-dependent oxidoreductase [Dermatophilus congolensis]
MRVVVTGAAGPLGRATCAALIHAGHDVVAVHHSAVELEQGLQTHVCDLTDPNATHKLAESVTADGPVDALFHLIGGWRGGKGLAGQTDEDYRFLESRIVTTLRNSTRAFLPALLNAAAPRVAIVSTTGLERCTAGNANYLATKAAAETWLACVGHALREKQGVAHVERVMALVTEADRAANPGKDYSRYSDVTDVAQRLLTLLSHTPTTHEEQ